MMMKLQKVKESYYCFYLIDLYKEKIVAKSNKANDNQIYYIAHPTVKNLVKQAVEVRRFRLLFPKLFNFLEGYKPQLTRLLFDRIYNHYTQYRNDVVNNETLVNDVNIIVSDRHILQVALDFIQNNTIPLYDRFLLDNGVVDELDFDIIFFAAYHNFENNLTQLNLEQDWNNAKEYMKKNNLFLSTLLPNWTMEQLLNDYLPIHISYSLFNDKPPTNKQMLEVLNPIFRYIKPRIKTKNSMIGFKIEDHQQKHVEHLGLKLALDEDASNIAEIFLDFLIKYRSEQIDYINIKNYDNKEKIIEENMKVGVIVNDLSNFLDQFVRKKLGDELSERLNNYDSLLIAIIDLVYFDHVLDTKFSEQDLTIINNYNRIDMYGQWVESNADLKDQYLEIKTEDKKYTYQIFLRNLKEILNVNDYLTLIIDPINHKQRNIKNINCVLNAKHYGFDKLKNKSFHNFSTNSLEQGLEERLIKLIPKTAELFVF